MVILIFTIATVTAVVIIFAITIINRSRIVSWIRSFRLTHGQIGRIETFIHVGAKIR